MYQHNGTLQIYKMLSQLYINKNPCYLCEDNISNSSLQKFSILLNCLSKWPVREKIGNVDDRLYYGCDTTVFLNICPDDTRFVIDLMAYVI